MATARSEQVDLSVTPFYHCMTRCVRRAFLCGDDRYSGKNFDHRKAWVRDRLHVLSGLFAIDVCAYAVMSNHLHVVLHVNEELAAGFSDDEVVRRYTSLYPMAKAKWELSLPKLERAGLLSEWRDRLTSISWLMRALSEFIARKANKEDRTRGRFWEGRFKSQAILDEQGLLTCMAYVDLNPIRAGLSASLEASDFTSIQERLRVTAEKMSQHRRRQPGRPSSASSMAASPPALFKFFDRTPKRLAPMMSDKRGAMPGSGANYTLPISLDEYVHLLEWTCGQLSEGTAQPSTKSATSFTALAARNTRPPALAAQGINLSGWLAAMQDHSLGTTRFLGSASSLEKHADVRQSKWLRGIRLARQMAA